MGWHRIATDYYRLLQVGTERAGLPSQLGLIVFVATDNAYPRSLFFDHSLTNKAKLNEWHTHAVELFQNGPDATPAPPFVSKNRPPWTCGPA
ncbi:hypothetical protein [Brucella gallinifaecis]|uniref:hypothetical protein n=1 Tax=Brucella gallinifaecis TaxID=215590 RepID=UPI00235E57C1|nr:hypothetical protein [Brucella gallinifaecis]